MKTKFRIVISFIKYLAILNILFLLSSCQKDKDNVIEPVNSYLIEYKFIKTLPVSSIKSTITLLSLSYPDAAPLNSTINYEVEVYRVTYKTHYKTEEITASGLICVPNSDEAFPLISFQNGTNTLKANAPSVNPNDPAFLFLESFAGSGYIMVIPDYIGFGASSQYLHPYYVIEPTTNAVVDLIHATKEFLNTGPVSAKLNSHNYLMGYSQGGWSTLCTFKYFETENDSITINAASCGAGAYDLINSASYIASQETFPSPLYLPYYIYSHQQYGTITDPLNLFFNEPYATRIPGLFDGMHSHGQINSELNDTISSLLKVEFISSLNNIETEAGIYSNIKADLIASSVEAWSIKGFLRFYHGNIDEDVSVSESRNINQAFQNLNSPGKVKYYELDGLNHDTGVIPWGVETFLWFNSLENIN